MLVIGKGSVRVTCKEVGTRQSRGSQDKGQIVKNMDN